MELTLGGKRALVTGASSGLGLHFSEVLARAGASVTLAARRTDMVETEALRLVEAGFEAGAISLDVTAPESVEAVFEDGRAFDIVINNAGISITGPAMDMSLDDFEAVVATNLTGVYSVARAAARSMRDRGGSIVNIASILGLRVSGHVSAYAASKAGVVHLTKALALEWARHGIRVNALCPGYVETPLNVDFFRTEAGQSLVRRIPQRRLGTPSDLDGPLLLLASDAGAYMTGSVIAVDGGHLVTGL